MAERRPDLAREHRLHDRFWGPPRASPVRFQVSRPADRTSRGWARGVPLAECRFPQGRPPDGSGGESERSTQNGRARRPCVVVVVAATPNYLRQASQNLGKYSKETKVYKVYYSLDEKSARAPRPAPRPPRAGRGAVL